MTDQELIQALRCCAEGECKGCAVYADKQSCQENILAQAADRLEGRIKAYGEGRIVVLPCKVGDMLYEVTGRKTISVYKVKAIRVELFSLFIEWDIVEGFVWQYLNGINANEIGKTVFLTREEAEAALEAMEDV